MKTNDSLAFAVVTGCLRISKESIFTGLNNLKIISVTNDSYGEFWGFIQDEVHHLADFYGLSQNMPMIRNWYDGYLFSGSHVYNPWKKCKANSRHTRGTLLPAVVFYMKMLLIHIIAIICNTAIIRWKCISNFINTDRTIRISAELA